MKIVTIKRQDFKMLMYYVDKEEPETVAIKIDENGFSASFTFLDKEARDCQIVLHESSISTEPDLIKKMKLKTRVKKDVKPQE